MFVNYVKSYILSNTLHEISVSAKINSLVITMHLTSVIGLLGLTHDQNILQPFFVGRFDVLGRRHLPTVFFFSGMHHYECIAPYNT